MVSDETITTLSYEYLFWEQTCTEVTCVVRNKCRRAINTKSEHIIISIQRRLMGIISTINLIFYTVKLHLCQSILLDNISERFKRVRERGYLRGYRQYSILSRNEYDFCATNFTVREKFEVRSSVRACFTPLVLLTLENCILTKLRATGWLLLGMVQRITTNSL